MPVGCGGALRLVELAVVAAAGDPAATGAVAGTGVAVGLLKIRPSRLGRGVAATVETGAGVAAGAVTAVDAAVFFECLTLAGLAGVAPEADGEAEAAGEAEASACFFLECLFLAGLADASGAGDAAVAVDGVGLCATEVVMTKAVSESAIVRQIKRFMRHRNDGPSGATRKKERDSGRGATSGRGRLRSRRGEKPRQRRRNSPSMRCDGRTVHLAPTKNPPHRLGWARAGGVYFLFGISIPPSATHCHFPSRSIQVSTQP